RGDAHHELRVGHPELGGAPALLAVLAADAAKQALQPQQDHGADGEAHGDLGEEEVDGVHGSTPFVGDKNFSNERNSWAKFFRRYPAAAASAIPPAAMKTGHARCLP